MLNKTLISILFFFLIGCDRVQYEIKDSNQFKSASKAYKALTRVPLPGQIEICKEKEKQQFSFYECMVDSGYKINQHASYYLLSDAQSASKYYEKEMTHKEYLDKNWNLAMRGAIKSPNQPVFWIEDN